MLLFSCSEKSDFQYSTQPKNEYKSLQLESIRQDIREKNKQMSQIGKLNLVLIDFQFRYPEKYEYLLSTPKWGEELVLTQDADFMRLCKQRGVSFDDFEYGVKSILKHKKQSPEDLRQFLIKHLVEKSKMN